MIDKPGTLLTATLFLTLAATGCARGTGTGAVQAPEPDASRRSAETIYAARQDSARMRYIRADADFMTGMIAHHAQALVMAALAPTNDASSSVRTLCARIINAQRDEIATMQQWLRDRGEPVPEVRIDGLHLMIHGVAAHHAHMPGMLTQAQLEQLDRARGAEFDRLFLTYMIQHHKGAVTMVHELFAVDGAAQGVLTFKLASDIQVDQLTEIERMERMLEAMQ